MRMAFINTLTELARKDPSVILLTGDLGFTVFESFRDEFPGRFFNIGVAEQNMMGIATGLALSGRTVFVYSIIPFLTLRAFEHIRNDIAHHNASVKLVGVGSGYSYGVLGASHYALEDIAVIRSLPHFTILLPADPRETELAIRHAATRPGPFYIRLQKRGEPILHAKHTHFKVGRGLLMREGTDVTLIASGTILEEALRAADLLYARGIGARVINMHTVKPLDKAIIKKAARETKMVCTVEEHGAVGGLGSAVAEVLSSLNPTRVVLKRFSAPDTFSHDIGSHEFLRIRAGLTAPSIAKGVLRAFRSKRA